MYRDASGHVTMVEVMTTGAVIGLITAIAMPHFAAIVSNANAALYQAGVSVVGSVHDGALAAGTKLSIEWEKVRWTPYVRQLGRES